MTTPDKMKRLSLSASSEIDSAKCRFALAVRRVSYCNNLGAPESAPANGEDPPESEHDFRKQTEL